MEPRTQPRPLLLRFFVVLFMCALVHTLILYACKSCLLVPLTHSALGHGLSGSFLHSHPAFLAHPSFIHALCSGHGLSRACLHSHPAFWARPSFIHTHCSGHGHTLIPSPVLKPTAIAPSYGHTYPHPSSSPTPLHPHMATPIPSPILKPNAIAPSWPRCCAHTNKHDCSHVPKSQNKLLLLGTFGRCTEAATLRRTGGRLRLACTGGGGWQWAPL